MSRVARVCVFAALFVGAVVALELPDSGIQLSPRVTPTPMATAEPPAITAAEADRQDRVGAMHRRREARAFDRRPLLSVLPLELAGVRIRIAGLAADDRTTILSISAGRRGRDFAEALYRRALAAYGDSGDEYTVQWSR